MQKEQWKKSCVLYNTYFIFQAAWNKKQRKPQWWVFRCFKHLPLQNPFFFTHYHAQTSPKTKKKLITLTLLCLQKYTKNFQAAWKRGKNQTINNGDMIQGEFVASFDKKKKQDGYTAVDIRKAE